MAKEKKDNGSNLENDLNSVEMESRGNVSKVESILHLIKNLTLIEVSELETKLKEAFNVQGGQSMSAQNNDSTEEVVEKKTEFTVMVKSLDASSNRLTTIKALGTVMKDSGFTTWSTEQSRTTVFDMLKGDSAPMKIQDNLPQKKADELKAKLSELGFEVEIV